MNAVLNILSGRVPGRVTLLLALVSIGWGVLILQILPYWAEMEAAQGGPEIQAAYHGAKALLGAQARLRAGAASAALQFYLWDIPNAVLFAVSMAALLRLALRLCGLERAIWLLALPLVSGAADLLENLTLIASLAGDLPLPLAWASAGLTAVKLATGQVAQLLVLALHAAALLRWGVVRFRSGQRAT